MESKTAKITRTTFVNEWSGPSGKVYYHEIELSNGDKGQIGSKEKGPAKLNPGSELTYTIEETAHGSKIKAVVPHAQGFKPGGGKPQIEPRIQMISFAMSYCKDCIVAGKVPLNDLEKEFNRIYNVMISKL